MSRMKFHPLLTLIMFSLLLEQNLFGVYSYAPQIDMSMFGHKFAIWENIDDNGNHYIQAATMQIGSSWSTDTTISSPGKYATNPKLVVDGIGNAVAIWSETDSTTGNNILFGAYIPISNVWTTPYRISSSLNDVLQDYVIKINETTNEVIVIWSAYGSGSTQRGVYCSSLIFGGTWTSPTLLSTSS